MKDIQLTREQLREIVDQCFVAFGPTKFLTDWGKDMAEEIVKAAAFKTATGDAYSWE